MFNCLCNQESTNQLPITSHETEDENCNDMISSLLLRILHEDGSQYWELDLSIP